MAKKRKKVAKKDSKKRKTKSVSLKNVVDQSKNKKIKRGKVKSKNSSNRPNSVKSKRTTFEKFYESLNESIMVISSSGEIIFANSSMSVLTGYDEEIKKKKVFELFKHACRRKVESASGVIFESEPGAVQNLSDLSLIKKSGKKVHVDFNIKYINLNGVDSAVVSIHNLSSLMELQREKDAYLKELNHMSKLADIGRLTAGVAHELNNPLMIIQGFAENIQLLFDEDQLDKEEMLQQVAPIVKASGRMAKIISTMMKVVRNDDVYMVQVDLIEVIEDSVAFLRNQFKQLDISIEKDIESNVGIVNCDPNQVEQIILNILNNAMHAVCDENSEKREIRISLKKDTHVKLGIWNSGKEISEDLKDRIMSPFFTTKAVGDGTGLGLFLSYGIMKAHDGTLTFTSSKSEGTEFTLTFPAVEMAEGLEASRPQRKFLVVDDEEYIRDLFKHKLTRYGYEVVLASDGHEAMELVHLHPDIECVFTDIRMPIKDGIQLIKEFRKVNHSALIYAISGYAGKQALQMKVRRLGIHGFLTKPIDHLLFSKVINEIEEHLNYVHGKGKKLVG